MTSRRRRRRRLRRRPRRPQRESQRCQSQYAKVSVRSTCKPSRLRHHEGRKVRPAKSVDDDDDDECENDDDRHDLWLFASHVRVIRRCKMERMCSSFGHTQTSGQPACLANRQTHLSGRILPVSGSLLAEEFAT